jgi:hypothetical protein
MAQTLHVPARLTEEAPDSDHAEPFRTSLRVLRMVAELHLRGFQGIRVLSYLSPVSSLRIELFPRSRMARTGHGFDVASALGERIDHLHPTHSSVSQDRPFGWADATDADPVELATLFPARFPELCREARHLDFAYAGWFATVVRHAAFGYLPIFFSEYEHRPDGIMMRPLNGGDHHVFPYPPIDEPGPDVIANPTLDPHRH